MKLTPSPMINRQMPVKMAVTPKNATPQQSISFGSDQQPKPSVPNVKPLTALLLASLAALTTACSPKGPDIKLPESFVQEHQPAMQQTDPVISVKVGVDTSIATDKAITPDAQPVQGGADTATDLATANQHVGRVTINGINVPTIEYKGETLPGLPVSELEFNAQMYNPDNSISAELALDNMCDQIKPGTTAYEKLKTDENDPEYAYPLENPTYVCLNPDDMVQVRENYYTFEVKTPQGTHRVDPDNDKEEQALEQIAEKFSNIQNWQ